MMGMPWVGLDRRLYADFRKTVAARSDRAFSFWPKEDESVTVRQSVLAIIQREMHWPSARFLPDDPCSILFFDPSPNMDSARAVLEIERILGKQPALERLSELTIGQLVAEIVRRS